MKITKVKTKAAEIEISKTELFALRQVFNEACYGIKIANFEETIGVSENEAEHFFDYFNDLEKQTGPGSPIIYKVVSQKSKQNNLEENRSSYGLRSEKYDLGFYVQKLNFTKSEIGFGIALQNTGKKEIITKIPPTRVSIKQLHREITLLKEGIHSFNYDTNTPTSYYFYNKAFKINLSAIEPNNSESSFKSQLAIEFIFEPRKKNDTFDTHTLNSSNTTKNFTSVTTPDKITRFVANVEDFLKSIIDSVVPSSGTAFKPKSGKKYFDNLR